MEKKVLLKFKSENGYTQGASDKVEFVTQGELFEKNGSVSAANIISAETNTAIYSLDMAMSGTSYFDAMYHNIDTLQEALQ